MKQNDKKQWKEQHIKTQANAKKGNIAGTLAVVMLAAVALYMLIQPRLTMKKDNPLLVPEKVTAQVDANGDMVLQLSAITEDVTIYEYEHDGMHMEVIAVKASDGSIRTAFNTCQVCYASQKGYYIPKGDYLECQNCKSMFHKDEVEKRSGGCNPVPIFDQNTTVTDEEIIIPAAFLQEASNSIQTEGWNQS